MFNEIDITNKNKLKVYGTSNVCIMETKFLKIQKRAMEQFHIKKNEELHNNSNNNNKIMTKIAICPKNIEIFLQVVKIYSCIGISIYFHS